LLGRLKYLGDNSSWEDFLARYRNLVYGLAKNKGLTDEEAADAVQETLIAVSRHIGRFQYDPTRSFRAWLLKIARSKIADQFRKRLPLQAARAAGSDTSRTTVLERVPAPTAYGFEAKWESENREHIQRIALEKLRATANSKHYQIFDAHVVKGWPVEKVSVALGVSADQVYKVKERFTKELKREVARLQRAIG
jgi:RNA polymerase sigma-70 factor (ECF subfamily)